MLSSISSNEHSGCARPHGRRRCDDPLSCGDGCVVDERVRARVRFDNPRRFVATASRSRSRSPRARRRPRTIGETPRRRDAAPSSSSSRATWIRPRTRSSRSPNPPAATMPRTIACARPKRCARPAISTAPRASLGGRQAAPPARRRAGPPRSARRGNRAQARRRRRKAQALLADVGRRSAAGASRTHAGVARACRGRGRRSLRGGAHARASSIAISKAPIATRTARKSRYARRARRRRAEDARGDAAARRSAAAVDRAGAARQGRARWRERCRGPNRPGGNDCSRETPAPKATSRRATSHCCCRSVRSSPRCRNRFATVFSPRISPPTMRIGRTCASTTPEKTPADAVAAYKQRRRRRRGPCRRSAAARSGRRALPPIADGARARAQSSRHRRSAAAPAAPSSDFCRMPKARRSPSTCASAASTRAAVITADTDWAERAALAFRAQFEASGGTDRRRNAPARRRSQLQGGDPCRRPAASAMPRMPASSSACVRNRRGFCCRSSRSPASPRRCSRPLTSIRRDANPGLDRDLDGVEFCDAPWLFGPVPAGRIARRSRAQIASANGVGARLFAFGMDAYALLPYMDWLLAHPDSYLTGATGDLTADSFGRMRRLTGWARFSAGIAQPVEGALERGAADAMKARVACRVRASREK